MITSARNEKIQLVRELLASKECRAIYNLFIIEGVRMAAEALAAGILPKLVLFSQQLSTEGLRLVDKFRAGSAFVEEVSSDLLSRVSDTRHCQGILLVLHQPSYELRQQVEVALALDQIRDPGNMGTILRSAAAFGFETVFLTPGCTDPFAPKVMRAGMGAHFKLHLHTMGPDNIAVFCRTVNRPPLKIWLADANNGMPCWNADLTIPLCLIIGGEAEGAYPDMRALADSTVRIPMQPHNESFNAAISASILMYEIRRQRRTA